MLCIGLIKEIVDGGGRITIIPPTLILASRVDLNVKLLLTLINNKWPPGDDPSGLRFVA